MNIRQLESFVALQETGSFRAAAERLFLSQPAISQQLHTLENELGIFLVDHEHRGVVLTPQGETFLPYARRIRDTYYQALKALKTEGETFFLHFVDRSPDDPLQHCILDFYLQHPECRIELQEPAPPETYVCAANLEKGHLYLCAKNRLQDGEIRFAPLGRARYDCLLSPEDPLCSGKSVSIKDLGSRTILLRQQAAMVTGPYMLECRRLFAENGTGEQVEEVMELSRMLALVASSRGSMISVVPYFVKMMDHSGVIRRPFLPEEEITMGFAYTGSLSQPMKEFIRLCRGCYEN